MDAYDEDPGARSGPGGPAGARLPDEPSAHDAGDREGNDRGDGRGASARTAPDASPRPGMAAGPEDPDRTGMAAGPEDPDRPGTAGRPDVPASPPAEPRTGVAALSPRYQVGAALALAVVGVAACVHLLMVFLSLAPANTVTKQHGKAVEEWVYPEFEQNWKLFAPNPLQQNIAVQVRAEARTKDGELRTTGWIDLSAQDGAAIDGNLAPSHTQQNELRRAWDFFTATHGVDNRPVGMRGSLSEQYLRRIVVMRLYRNDPPDKLGVIQRVQVRSSTTNVQPPKWSPERVSDQPVYRLLPWWTVTADEAAGGVR
ncbi:DUF5819 family protein [Streptomyces camelliae]|uniref:DUF5819 family protein n=1 Tax=Streptomyces camelliae TaxID=3004093 RepID=A0ABY7P6W8_9ACTN|nr:DUF5819 family protein [Streptomyces sp. HUAS 2-6]WBO65083.1 DUF5819 family protein [Streptomyces sp. HUAS 2-6]